MRFTRLAACAAALLFCSAAFAQEPPTGILYQGGGLTGMIKIAGSSFGQCLVWGNPPYFTACGAGSMTWPTGSAGVPNYNGASGWGTSYSASNPIPANFVTVPTFTGDMTNSGTVTTVSKVNGATFPTSATVVGSNSSAQPVAASTTGSGSVVLATAPTVSNLTVTGTCTGCGSGSSVTLQTNGTNNASQTALNLQNGQGVVITNPSGGNATIATTVPQRTVTTSPTIASTDMGGVVIMNVTGGGTLTVPAISSTVLASGMSVGIVNYSASTAAVSTTPTINSGGGCVPATGIPSKDTWQLISNGTSLDCIQTVPNGGGLTSQIAGTGTSFVTPSGTQYMAGFFGNGLGGEPSQSVPKAGTISNLYVSGPSEGAAATLQITLRDNATSESVTCTIPNNGNSCSDLTHTFSFSAGDKLDWQTIQTGTGTGGTYYVTFLVQ